MPVVIAIDQGKNAEKTGPKLQKKEDEKGRRRPMPSSGTALPAEANCNRKGFVSFAFDSSCSMEISQFRLYFLLFTLDCGGRAFI